MLSIPIYHERKGYSHSDMHYAEINVNLSFSGCGTRFDEYDKKDEHKSVYT